MHLFLMDETNRMPSESARFLIYGGLAMPVEQLSNLDADIESIRAKYGYANGDTLKFDTNARPDGMAVSDATAAKREVISACRARECVFIAYAILHKIIRNKDPSEQLFWAADQVLSAFHDFLASEEGDGICVMDNVSLGNQWKYLSSKFQHGLESQEFAKRLDRIKLFASSCVGASHSNSAMDIVLGTFRYCVNARANPSTSAPMLKSVAELMWSKDGNVRGRGLLLRPLEVQVAEYREEYDGLVEHLNELHGASATG